MTRVVQNPTARNASLICASCLAAEMTTNRHRQSSMAQDYPTDAEIVSTGVTRGSLESYGKESWRRPSDIPAVDALCESPEPSLIKLAFDDFLFRAGVQPVQQTENDRSTHD